MARASLAAGILALACVAVLVPVYAHEGHGKPQGATFDPDAPKRVSAATAAAIGLTTAEIDFGHVEDVIRLTGTVRARPGDLIALAPTYPAVVAALPVQAGDRVRTGDVLAELVSTELARAEYEVFRLEADAEKLAADAQRADSQVRAMEIRAPVLREKAQLAAAEVARLAEGGASVSANLLAQRRADAITLQADAEQAVESLAQAKAEAASLLRQVEKTRASSAALRATLPAASDGTPPAPGVVRLVSPIDGVVVYARGTIGEGVSAGAGVVTVGRFDSVQVEGELPEGLLERAGHAVGAVVRVYRGSDGDFTPARTVLAQGRVRFTSPIVDPTQRTSHVIVEVDNPAGSLRPGQYVELAMVLGERDSAVIAPAQAIIREGPLQYVFVQEGTGENITYRKRDVATGVRDDRVVEITQGLVPGDIIAERGAFSLSQLRGFTAPAPSAEGRGGPR